MLEWSLPVIVGLLGLCTYTVQADTIRGVNLGGWLLVEEWYLTTPGDLDRCTC
jgi:hypothetical protein